MLGSSEKGLLNNHVRQLICQNRKEKATDKI